MVLQAQLTLGSNLKYMKNIITPIFTVFVISLTALFTSCSGGDEADNTPQTTERSASYTVNGTATTVEKPYDGIFVNNGEVNNTVSLTAKDGSKIKFIFIGKTTATYQLVAYPDAVYTNSAGQNYNAVRGQLNVTNYKIVDGIYTFSGNFNFVAKNITNANDSVVVTNGIITNCSNKF